MKFVLLLLTGILFFAACSNVEIVKTRNSKGKVTEEYQRLKKGKVRHGYYKTWFENGNLNQEASYENGVLNGKCIFHYESGKLMSIEHHKNGLFSGKYEKYYESGQLFLQGNYKNNEMSGSWKTWYPDGILKEEISFSRNEENGPFREYHPNGKLKTEGQYFNGEFEHGELRKYGEDGQLIERMYCEEGVCMSVWTKEKGDISIDTVKMRRLVELKNNLRNDEKN
jgi:antitoxin component YwqK of YwqJK toxin-antitoxin module